MTPRGDQSARVEVSNADLVTTRDAQRNLPRLVRELESGERGKVVVTSHGKMAAILTAVGGEASSTQRENAELRRQIDNVVRGTGAERAEAEKIIGELRTRALAAEQALERADELARAVAKEWLLPSNHSERLREAAQSYLASRAPAQEER